MMAIQTVSKPALSAGFVLALTSALSAQPATTPPPSQPATTRPAAQPRETAPFAPTAQSRAAAPQGFSVVLVLGDIQAAAASDDVPVAARKALTDMKDFLAFKSYRLLDAAWVLCCGTAARRTGEYSTQMLRGPDGQEYELKMTTSRADGNQILVRFVLDGSNESATTVSDAEASAQRRLADAQDRKANIEAQLREARQKVEIGTAPASEVTKLEMELRIAQRRIQELGVHAANVETGQVSRASSRTKRTVLDTTFTMDVGETVVVGTSRLKGGSKALIALLTAVPPRGSATPRD